MLKHTSSRFLALLIALCLVLTPCGAALAREIATPAPTATQTTTAVDLTLAEKSTVTATPKPTATATPKPTATATPKPTETATPKPTATATPKPTATATSKPTVTATPKPTATATPKPTATATPKPTATATSKPTATATLMPTATTASTPSPSPAATDDAQEETIPLGVDDLLVLEQIAAEQANLRNRFYQAETSSQHYADYAFGSVQTLTGIFSTIGLYAEIPDYAAPTEAILRISYTASNLILTSHSSLTFYMNGSPFHSDRIAIHAGGGETVLYIPIPVSMLQQGYNYLQIKSYVRLTDDEGCTDDFNDANWLRIAETTCLRIGYEVKRDAESLEYFPYPLISMMDTTGANAAIAVSDAADNSELEAALTVMAGLGSSVSEHNELELCRLSETTRQHVLYFGLKQNTDAKLLALLTREVPPTGALVQRAQLDEQEYVLVIAQEKEALTEAARLLCDKSRVKQLRDAATYVSVGEAQRFLDAAQLSPLALDGQYTIKDIAGHGISFAGPFHQEATIYLPVADDYTLSSESRFTFTIRYSENLDFDRSLMTVYWGTDVPLYSRQLRQDGATGETVSFAVPSDAVGMAGTALTIAFDLEVKDLDCTPRQMNMPWAYIAEDSVMYLPHGGSSTFSLGSLPAPFQHNSRMDNVMMVLAEQPLKDELLLAGRAMAMLGAGSTPYGSIRVVRDTQFDATEADANLVVAGFSTNNQLLKRLNPHLLFQYSDDMRRVLSNEKLILDESYAQTVGIIQMIASPYAPERALLVLSAPSSEGLGAVTDAISAARARWALEKEAVLATPHGGTESYQFNVSGQTLQTQQKPTFVQTVMENKEPMLLLLTGMGCMALALLGVVIVLIRIRARKRKE